MRFKSQWKIKDILHKNIHRVYSSDVLQEKHVCLNCGNEFVGAYCNVLRTVGRCSTHQQTFCIQKYVFRIPSAGQQFSLHYLRSVRPSWLVLERLSERETSRLHPSVPASFPAGDSLCYADFYHCSENRSKPWWQWI